MALETHGFQLQAERFQPVQASAPLFKIGGDVFAEVSYFGQAALLGIRGIAVSAPAAEEPRFDAIRSCLHEVLEMLLVDTAMSLVNVNFPAGAPRGILWTRQSVRHYDGKVVPGKDPMGRLHYWFTVVPVEGTDEDTDRWAFERGYVSMTPLRLDLTDEEQLAQAKKLVSLKKISFG